MTAAILSRLAGPLFKVVDQLVSDPDLKSRLQSELSRQMLDNQSEISKAAAEVVVAEAQGESWLQRNWRPMLMVWFALLIGAYWFGFVPANMPASVVQSLFTLVQIGVGGYIVGRSGEKITRNLKGG